MTDTTLIDGVATRPATATDLATFKIAEQKLNGMLVPKLYDATDPHARVFYVLSDGTGNDAINDPEHMTNVGILNERLKVIKESNPNIGVGYLAGPGTQGGPIGLLDSATGGTYEQRVEALYDQLGLQTKIWHQEDPDIKVRVIEIGFSRGGVQAVGVSNLVDQRGIQDPDGKRSVYDPITNQTVMSYTTAPLVPRGQVAQALGLYEPVGTGVPSAHDLQPSSSVLSGFQITSGHERRGLFPSMSVMDQDSTDPRFLGVTTAGVHTDNGGGYLLNGLSILNFNLMAKYVNALMGIDGFIQPITPPADPAMYVIHKSEDHQWFYRALDQRETVHQLNAFGAQDAKPVDENLARQFEYANVGGVLSPGIPFGTSMAATQFLADGTANDLNSIAAVTGISVEALLAANSGLSADTSIAPGTLVNLPVTNTLTLTSTGDVTRLDGSDKNIIDLSAGQEDNNNLLLGVQLSDDLADASSAFKAEISKIASEGENTWTEEARDAWRLDENYLLAGDITGQANSIGIPVIPDVLSQNWGHAEAEGNATEAVIDQSLFEDASEYVAEQDSWQWGAADLGDGANDGGGDWSGPEWSEPASPIVEVDINPTPLFKTITEEHAEQRWVQDGYDDQVWVDTSYTDQQWVASSREESYQYWVDESYMESRYVHDGWWDYRLDMEHDMDQLVEYWVDASYYEDVWVPAGHWETASYTVDTSHMEEVRVTQGHYETRHTDTSHYETVYNTVQIQVPFADPVVFDLDGNGLKLSAYSGSDLRFDVDNDLTRSQEVTGWVGPGDGLLAMDINGNGKIDGARELISEYLGAAAGTRSFTDGLQALQALDKSAAGSKDSKLNSGDVQWSNLRVWVDENQNAQSDAGELKTLAELGITEIDLATRTPVAADKTSIADNSLVAVGGFTRNGLTQTWGDVLFKANPNGVVLAASGLGQIITTDAGTKSYVTSTQEWELLSTVSKGVHNLYAGAGDDELTGDEGSNWLAGGAGSDSFHAGGGDDVLLIDAQDKQANIHAGGGTDLVRVTGEAGITLNLAAAEVEIAEGGDGADVLIGGGRSSVVISGGGGDDVLIGGAANDVLAGDAGADLLDGGAGDDLVRGGQGDDSLYGGSGNDVIDGGSGHDALDGGLGQDIMTGGLGNDFYVVDNPGDAVIELAGEGTDTVQAAISHSLADNVENLTLTGAASTGGTGNALNNSLVGNAAANVLTGEGGNDTLNGGAGTDTLAGGLGNDTYLVDNPGDAVIELAGEGTDTVQAAISYSLANNVENLTLTGAASTGGNGNSLANQLTGNSAANVLSGGSGDDTYVFNLGGGSDTLIELNGQGHDTLRLGEGISATPASIRTSREGSDLILSLGAAGNDLVRMSGYFDVDGGTVETIAFANGRQWDFHNVIGWMASVDAPATKVKYFLKRIGGEELDLVHPVVGLGQASAPAMHIVNGTSGADTLHIGAGMRVDARMLASGADSIYLPGRLDDYLQAIDQDSGTYTLAHRTRQSEVIQFTSVGDDDVLYFADGHIVFNALTDARLYDENTGVFLPVEASYLQPGGAPVNAPDVTLAIQGIAGTTLNATLSRPLATVLTDAQAQGSLATGSPMVVYVTGVNGQDIAPLPRSGQAMKVSGGIGADSVYVTPGTAVDARVLGGGDDRICFTGQLNDYTQAIDQDSGVYTFTHKSRPNETVKITSMGEDDVLYFRDGHIVFNAVDDTRLYDESGAGFAQVDASWLSAGGTPILTERLEYSADGGVSWQDVSGSVTGSAVSLSDPALTSGSTVRLRVASQGASGAEAAQLVTGPGDDRLEITASELAGLAGPAGARYDGRGGEDTLALRSDQGGVLLDFTAFAPNSFQGIERVDISGAGSNTARLGLAQLLGLPDEDQSQLIVLGDADDSVLLVGGAANWSSQGPLHWQATDFEVYAHAGAPERSLLLQQGMAMFVM